MKIGIFGGSFNPIHNNHVKIIDKTLYKKLVEEVWIVPCGNHAFGKDLLNSKHRVKMIEYAIREIKNVKINYIELDSKGVNYTVDTIRKLKKEFSHNFYFIIGSDVLFEFNKWHKYKELIKENKFLVFKRKNYPIQKLEANMHLIENSALELSSTEIRKRIRQGKSISGLVPVGVENYIIKEEFYND